MYKMVNTIRKRQALRADHGAGVMKAGNAPRTGKRLFTWRLIPRTQKECGCNQLQPTNNNRVNKAPTAVNAGD